MSPFAAQTGMMKRCICILSFFLCHTAATHAQTAQPKKIVYLYDGTKVRGSLTQNDSAGFIMVLDRHHETHYYDTSLISRIEDEAPHYLSYGIKPRGYICHIESGGTDIVPSRIAGASLPSFSLHVVNSYLFSPYVSLGLGVGTELSASGYNLEMVSVYADTRVYFIKSDISPYLDLAFGYNAMFMKYTDYDTFALRPPTVREIDNGLMFNPSLGVRVAITKKVAMTADIGYKLYYLLTPDNAYYIISGDATFQPDAHGYYLFNAVTLKAGFQF